MDCRVDKWLWAVRVFKTRSIATDAVKKGRVEVNDVIVKPSRMLKVGDIVKVRKSPVTYSFRVIQLVQNRLGAKLVPEYMENITPQSELDILDMVRIAGFVDRRKGLGRPTKKEGRELEQFTSELWSDFDDDIDLDDDEDEEEED
ncbi:MAG: RNA-binding S4 domain-containing protein [Muribaculaceae bacterium]|nr:RNA-binding S4 domain-containing protein [Muribaculaceae bacterium]MDE6427591.1 RNA-binding S4 domain-containing protein [Muribaculaceae bacterium]